MVRHADNDQIWRLRDRFPHPYTRSDAEHWIASARRQDPQTSFAIEVQGEAVGVVGLEVGSDIERRSVEIGYWLGDALWGKGIATDAVRATTGYGFEALASRASLPCLSQTAPRPYASWISAAMSGRG